MFVDAGLLLLLLLGGDDDDADVEAAGCFEDEAGLLGRDAGDDDDWPVEEGCAADLGASFFLPWFPSRVFSASRSQWRKSMTRTWLRRDS